MFAVHITYVTSRSSEVKAPQLAVCPFADGMFGAQRYDQSSLEDCTYLISRLPRHLSPSIQSWTTACAAWPPSKAD